MLQLLCSIAVLRARQAFCGPPLWEGVGRRRHFFATYRYEVYASMGRLKTTALQCALSRFPNREKACLRQDVSKRSAKPRSSPKYDASFQGYGDTDTPIIICYDAIT